MRAAAGAAVGIVFGFILCWSGMADPDVIRGALLLEQSYLFLFFGSAVLTAAVGQVLLRRVRRRAVLTDEDLVLSRMRPERRHLVGSLIFGLGWGAANVCPGPIAAQLGEGIPWALCTATGLVAGVILFTRRGGAETEPASDARSAPAQAPARARSRRPGLEERPAAG